MTCAHCAEMARQAASLRDEVENWRAWGRPDPQMLEAERMVVWRRALPMDAGAARALLRLVDGCGRAVSFQVLAMRPGISDDVDVSGNAKVYISRLKSALAAAGVSIQIEAVRGYGYMLERAEAQRLRAMVETPS